MKISVAHYQNPAEHSGIFREEKRIRVERLTISVSSARRSYHFVQKCAILGINLWPENRIL
jgi:hypothetical protein